MTKKAILAVSFGTAVPETRRVNIEAVENELSVAFPEWEVRRAFTSRMIRDKIASEEGILIDSPAVSLGRLGSDGFTEVVVQSLHVIPGEEYYRLVEALEPFEKAKVFDRLSLGRPLLFHQGVQPGVPDDYRTAVEALRAQLPIFTPEERGHIILMGHGSEHAADRCYDIFQERIDAAGLPVFNATVEGSRTFEAAMDWLKAEEARRVLLMPFMLVAGDHAINDMAGTEKDSWQSRLKEAGYQVSANLRGLGENPAFRKIFVEHARAAMDKK